MPADLVLAGNGPGELTGWIAPVARAARAGGTPVRITLALTPSQFAGGRELEVADAWGLFDRVLPPRSCVRLAFGMSRLERDAHGVLVHLGGDFWLSGRIAAHLGLPACAFAETPLVARRHRLFRRIFASSDSLAEALRARGVPAEKITVSGDPRADAFTPAASAPGATAPPQIAFLPGSRDRFFRVGAPYFINTAAHLAASIPGLSVQIVASEFLSPPLVADMRRRAADQWPGLAVTWVADDSAAALARADLVVTIPGTNTMELGLIAAPFVVVLPLQRIDLIPLEGLLEWVSRLPAVGRRVKRAALAQYLRRERYLALPNRRARREIVPEWIGTWTPAQLAATVAELWRDRARRERIRADLQALRPAQGASRLIAEQALQLA